MMKRTFKSMLPAAALLLALAGCDKEEAAPAPAPARTASTGPDLRTQIEQAGGSRGIMLGRATREFERYGSRLRRLRSAAATAGNEPLDALIETIGEKLTAAGSKLEELKAAGDANIQTLQTEFKLLLLDAQSLMKQADEHVAAMKAGGG